MIGRSGSKTRVVLWIHRRWRRGRLADNRRSSSRVSRSQLQSRSYDSASVTAPDVVPCRTTALPAANGLRRQPLQSSPKAYERVAVNYRHLLGRRGYFLCRKARHSEYWQYRRYTRNRTVCCAAT